MAGGATTVQLVPACQGPPPVDGASARLRPVKASLGRVEAGGGEAEGSKTAQPVRAASPEMSGLADSLGGESVVESQVVE